LDKFSNSLLRTTQAQLFFVDVFVLGVSVWKCEKKGEKQNISVCDKVRHNIYLMGKTGWVKETTHSFLLGLPNLV
jgi:hypothetical protein